MRAILIGCGVCLAATILCSAATRVAVMDFEDQTGMRADARLGGAIAPGALAAKGIPLLAKQLVGNEALDVIDRRDFLNQIDKLRPKPILFARRPSPARRRRPARQPAELFNRQKNHRPGRLQDRSRHAQLARHAGSD